MIVGPFQARAALMILSSRPADPDRRRHERPTPQDAGRAQPPPAAADAGTLPVPLGFGDLALAHRIEVLDLGAGRQLTLEVRGERERERLVRFEVHQLDLGVGQ
jgi:hypothetical protein